MFKQYENDSDRLKEISKSFREKDMTVKDSVEKGDKHEWAVSDYLTLCNSECFFCGDNTYNYLTRLDETKNFHPDNLVSECGNCRKIRGPKDLTDFKKLADKE